MVKTTITRTKYRCKSWFPLFRYSVSKNGWIWAPVFEPLGKYQEVRTIKIGPWKWVRDTYSRGILV